MESGQDQFLLAGIRIDVAHGEDSRDVGLEFFGIDLDCAFVDGETPLRDRPELGVKSEEHQSVIRLDILQLPVGALHSHSAEMIAFRDHGVCNRFDVVDAAVRNQIAHACDRCGCGTKFGATMYEGEAARLAGKLERPVERGVAAAENGQTLADEVARTLHLVMHVLAFEGFAALDAQPPRLERTQAARDDHGLGMKARRERSTQQEGVVLEHLQLGDFLSHVELRIEGFCLLQQSVHQFLRTADRQCRNVIDRLLRIKLAALPARVLERVHDVRVNSEQPELEDLKQSARTRPDDYDVGLNRAGSQALKVTQCRSPANKYRNGT